MLPINLRPQRQERSGALLDRGLVHVSELGATCDGLQLAHHELLDLLLSNKLGYLLTCVHACHDAELLELRGCVG